MQQVLQSMSTGRTRNAEIPAPIAAPGMVLVRNRASVISSGTERMLIDFGRANLVQKARSQPEKVRQTLHKVRTDGLAATLDTIWSTLEQPFPLGYSSAGEVLAVGEDVEEFRVGDRIASNGPHAGVVLVPKRLCAAIPSHSGGRTDPVSYEEAAFTVLGAIGLQGVRLARPSLGEFVVVIGLGLIGLITAQILQAHGCRVVGLDFDVSKLRLAQATGLETIDLSAKSDVVSTVRAFTRHRGADAVIITAATTSTEPIRQAAAMCRKRGHIVLVGVAGLDLVREDFYQKELTFQVSCSYGPGRYDPAYEHDGTDYPIGFVRWTEQRNFEAVLDMMAIGRLDVRPLITHTYPIQEAEAAYALLATGRPHAGVVLKYDGQSSEPAASLRIRAEQRAASPGARIAFIGAGQFAMRFLAPAFAAAGARLAAVVSQKGASAAHMAEKHGFTIAATDARVVLDDPNIDAVVIATRHDTHAELAVQALQAKKHVFVEKPVAIYPYELDRLAATIGLSDRLFHVGFNRRWSPHAIRLRQWVSAGTEPACVNILINAGSIPSDHWTQQRSIGGGRVIGEVCHFIDLSRFLTDSPVERWAAERLRGSAGSLADTIAITLVHCNGSFTTINYLANGSKTFPKERVEVFQGGKIAVLENFNRLVPYGWSGARRYRTWRQDKGHRANVKAFVDRLSKGGPPLIAWQEVEEVTRLTLEISASL